jgi:hypothetical protein
LTLNVVGQAGTETGSLDALFRQRLGIGMNLVNVVDKLEAGLVVDER